MVAKKKASKRPSITAQLNTLRDKLKVEKAAAKLIQADFVKAEEARVTAVNKGLEHVKTLETHEATILELNETVVLKTEVIEELATKQETLEAQLKFMLERADARAGIIGRLAIQVAKTGEAPNIFERLPDVQVLPDVSDYKISVKAAKVEE